MISWYVSHPTCVSTPRTLPPNQEFGIDIVGEDNKTIVHHKVAARVVCVFTDQDAQAAARAEAQQNPPTYGALGQAPGVGGAPGAFNFAGAGGPGASNGMPGAQRRTTMQPQGLVGMGGLGGGARQPGKSGLTFDHILSRLQGELQKSRETGAELHSLTGAMNDIHETLGGNLVRFIFSVIASIGLRALQSATKSPTVPPNTTSRRPPSAFTTCRPKSPHIFGV